MRRLKIMLKKGNKTNFLNIYFLKICIKFTAAAVIGLGWLWLRVYDLNLVTAAESGSFSLTRSAISNYCSCVYIIIKVV